jgi:class 3 adenylate cyclase
VDSPGDNLLAEFSSVVDAVQCAVAVQSEIQTRNAELAETRRMEFRIGINLGDVIDEEDRIYGDGVNVAPDWSHCQILVAYACQRRLSIRLSPSSHWDMNIWDNSQLKIYPSRWALTEY